MKANTSFDINSKSITSVFDRIIKTIQESKFKIVSKTGKTYLHIPLIFALIIGIVFPVTLIALLIGMLIFKLTVSVEKETDDKETKMIDLK